MKTLQERINRFIEKYSEPEQFQFQLYWNRADGKHSETIGTGKELVYWRNMVSRSVGKPMYAANYRYDAETELMECSYAIINCNVPKPNENRKWKYAERYFIPKEEKKVYDINGNYNRYAVNAASYHTTTYDARYFLQNFTRLHTAIEMFSDAFLALTNGNPDVPPRFESSVKYPWIITEWIRHRPIVYKNSKTQKIIDDLSLNELETTSLIVNAIKKADENESPKYYWREQRYAYFDKANNVFRIYRLDNDDVVEVSRVYHHKNKFVTAKLDADGKWVKNSSFTSNQFGTKITNLDDIYNMPYKSYLKDMECKTVYRIVNAIRNPEIEQLTNMGCNQLAKRTAQNDHPTSFLKDMLGEPINKSKNVCSRYGLTQKQLKTIDTIYLSQDVYSSDCYGAAKRVKSYLGVNALSSIGDDFEKYYQFVVNTGSWKLRIFENITNDERKKAFIKIVNMTDKHANAAEIFFDTLSTYNSISIANKPDVRPYDVRNYEELIRMHDSLVEIKRIEDAERRRMWDIKEAERHALLEKKMAKLDEKRKELNYEDDNFLIRIPEKLSEIVNEGASLHHCVGGYTDRHASGDTTILFLRKKSDPSTSFYTIELLNNNTIQQIHGFGNRWLGNNPEAIATVARWLLKNGISCTDQILRGTAKGYSGNNILVPMPEI